jgi:hypothetical protein
MQAGLIEQHDGLMKLRRATLTTTGFSREKHFQAPASWMPDDPALLAEEPNLQHARRAALRSFGEKRSFHQ